MSEFRSPYFYLVEDATSANGYALKYTDTKYFDAAEVEAAAIPMAAAEAQAKPRRPRPTTKLSPAIAPTATSC